VIKDTRKKPRRVEADLQKLCLEYLTLCGCFMWRQNTGAMTGEHKGRKWYVRFGVKGLSDIIGVTPEGLFIAVEVKRPGQEPTADQTYFLHRVALNNGIAIWCDSWESFEGKCRLWNIRPAGE
jgi:hypothetical protein